MFLLSFNVTSWLELCLCNILWVMQQYFKSSFKTDFQDTFLNCFPPPSPPPVVSGSLSSRFPQCLPESFSIAPKSYTKVIIAHVPLKNVCWMNAWARTEVCSQYPQWAKGARTELRRWTLAPAIFPQDPGAFSRTQTAKLEDQLKTSVWVYFMRQQLHQPRIPICILLCTLSSRCKLQPC